MRWLANRIMSRRAARLLARLRPYLPVSGTVADIGAGTGHNAEAIRRATPLRVREFDVADLHWVGPGPVLFDEPRLPADPRAFDALLVLYVLQYAESPAALLAEMRRIASGRVIVIQSTYRGWWGRTVLAVREFCWGRLAFYAALWCGVLSSTGCPLAPRRYFTRSSLCQVFATAGFQLVAMQGAEWHGFNVSRDLFVLEPHEP